MYLKFASAASGSLSRVARPKSIKHRSRRIFSLRCWASDLSLWPWPKGMAHTTVAHGSPRFCPRNTKRYVSESWHVKAMEWNGTYFGMSTVFLGKGPVGGLNFKHLSSRVICSYSIKCIQMCLSHLQLTHCGIASVCWFHYFSGCSGFSETPRWDASPEALRPPQWSAPRCFFDRGSGAPERWEGWMAQWMAMATSESDKIKSAFLHSAMALWSASQTDLLTNLLGFHGRERSANLVSDFIWNIHHGM